MGWETRFQNNDPSYLEPRISNAESSLAQKTQEYINVKNPPAPLVAAKGDGATDDTVAIQAMINYLPSSDNYYSDIRGGKLFFPPGIYRKTASILLKGGITLEGTNKDSAMILDDGTNDDSFKAIESGTVGYNISVRNLKFKHTDGATTGAALNIGYNFASYGANKCMIENVYIYNYYNGIKLGNIVLVKTSGLHIEKCVSDGFITSGSSNLLLLTNTWVSLCGGHAYNINNCNYCKFSNCGADTNTGDAYHFNSINNTSLDTCGAEHNGGTALWINSGQSVECNNAFFNPNNGDIIYLNNVNGITLINCDGVSPTSTAYAINNNGTTKHINIIGGYLNAPMGVKDGSVIISMGTGGANTNAVGIGTLSTTTNLLYLQATTTDDENMIRLSKKSAGTYYMGVNTGGQFKIKNATYSPIVMNVDAPDYCVYLTNNGLEANNGVVLKSSDGKKYKLVVDTSGNLTTVLIS